MDAKRILGVGVFVFLMTMFLATAGRAQQTTAGSFRGTVTDQTGGVIPGVTVLLTNPDMGQTWETVTNETGFYALPKIPPGVYTFRLSFQGFQTLVSEGARLQTNQDATVDFTMQPGAVVEEVTVTAAAPLLNATTATLGTVVERQKVVQLPLNGRQFTQLILLTPGVAPQSTGQHFAFEVTSDIGAISPAVNGQRPTANNFTLDGVENNELFFNFSAISPPPDAIEEFKVQSYASSGAFGRGPGANVNVSTRSGTNEFHGAVWDFLRNDALDASNFFSNFAGIDKPPFRFNQFGATAGGPIIKNKTWVFGYYEGLRKSIGQTLFATVPTPAQLAGDLSGFRPIFDPESTEYMGSDANGDPIFTRTPFPQNRIPADRLDPTIQSVAKFYPAPNLPAAPGGSNFINTATQRTNLDQFGVRVDSVLPKDVKFFSRFSFADAARPEEYPLPNQQLDFFNRYRQVVAGITRNFGPTTVVDLRGQFLRHLGGRNRVSDPEFLRQSGILDLFPTPQGQPPFLPNLNPGGGFTPVAQGKFTPVGPFNSWEVQGSVTKITGKHTITVGGSLMYTDGLHDDNYGYVNFRREETADPGDLANTGESLASFLLGVPDDTKREAGVTQVVLHGNYLGLFVDDQWRVTPNLTLTLGLRYDYSEPKKEKYDRRCGWDFFGSQPGSLMPGADPTSEGSYARGGFTKWDCVAGAQDAFFVTPQDPLNTIPRGYVRPDKNNFGPRVSLAYRLGSNTVVRSGIGIFYEFNQSDYQTLIAIMGQWPFGQPSGTASGSNRPTVTRPKPQFTFQKGIFPPFEPVTRIPISPTFSVNTENRTPYVTEWNLGVERSFGNDWLVAVRYLGSAGTHLGTLFNMNLATTPGPGAIAPRRTLPQHGGGFLYHHATNSNYHAGQAKVEKRFSQGLSFLMSYTFSKSIDIISGETSLGGSGQGRPNFHMDWNHLRGPSVYDLTQNLSFSYVYDLPFGQGKPYGGWQLTGILRLHNGFPFGITTGDVANQGGGTQTPTLVGELLPSGFKQTREQWFNADALEERPFTIGNLGRNVIRADGFQNFDFGILKRTNFTENLALEFRTEFFNLFNKTNFAAPDGNFRSGNFGSILRTELSAANGGNRVIQFGLKFIF